jgi:hypothetical protein
MSACQTASPRRTVQAGTLELMHLRPCLPRYRLNSSSASEDMHNTREGVIASAQVREFMEESSTAIVSRSVWASGLHPSRFEAIGWEGCAWRLETARDQMLSRCRVM